ncbi:MAG: hypothetical protein F6K65_02380 [Moorea sp. SIO3C2]|nr:hypothetical protein [Moorena sp. SIO3C2]
MAGVKYLRDLSSQWSAISRQPSAISHQPSAVSRQPSADFIQKVFP